MKKILNSDTLKTIALETIIEVASIVKTTLGPGGNSILIQNQGSNPDGTPAAPTVTKDGVTVASSIIFRDASKNTVAQAIIQTAKNTVQSAGDGTTTAIVLAEAIYKAGFKYIKQGTNGIQLYTALQEIKDQVVAYIDAIKTPVELKDVIDVARISANGDEEIARIVADAIMSVGEDGHIALEESFSKETSLTKVEGAVYKQGWRGFGPHGSLLVTDRAKNICELEKPAILIFAGKLQDVHELTDFIFKVMGGDRAKGQLKNIIPMMIIAHDYSDEVKNFIVQNRVQAKMPIAAIKAPFDGSPNSRTEMAEDLAVLVGGKVFAKGILELDQVQDDHLGCADKIVISAEETVIYGGHGSEADILSRVNDLKQLQDSRMYDFDKENARLRIGKLVGGIAIVRAGGSSELEMREKKDRIEDALCAAKVAIADGIVAGGGLTLYNISKKLMEELKDSPAKEIMIAALQAPMKQIITNIGENPEVIISHLPEGQGYDSHKRIYCDMLASGIVDPSKVTKSALENAVSIAGLLLTTGGSIVNDVDSQDGKANPLAGLMG